jgi:ApaG protein
MVPMSDKPRNRVEVSVKTRFDPERSNPAESFYFYIYTITIRNTGALPCQLLSRHWIITDATGHVEEVRGPGVVGQQPVLQPGQSHTYTSGCPLHTPVGSMRGSYQMIDSEGRHFDAEIPAFTLAQKYDIN